MAKLLCACLDITKLQPLHKYKIQWQIQDFKKGGRQPKRGGTNLLSGKIIVKFLIEINI